MRAQSDPQSLGAPPLPRAILSLGVTGHRDGNPALAANRARIAATIAALFDQIAAEADRAVAARAEPGTAAGAASVRLHSLLADGSD
ncbi:hypothetical protein, partial [Sandarakinorhabdus rubra]|uniref:hypothetical protein n=1 Tax=Sandarakinorhabdus rubra TaxID=2672568 RepID=UPI0013D95CB1